MAALDVLSRSLFDDIVASAEACDVVLPGCRYVSHCAPALDCCDVMAFYPDVITNDVSVSGVKCLISPNVTFVLELWWCVSVPENMVNGFVTPDPSITTLESLEMQDSAYTVFTAAIDAVNSSSCGAVINARLECLDPQGGCAGWKITFTTKLEA